MNKEKVKTKAKEFWEKNKFYIGYGVGAGVMLIGAIASNKICERRASKDDMRICMVNNRVADMLVDTEKFKGGVYTQAIYSGLKLNDMGKLAEYMKESGVPEEGFDFTHFIIFGKQK